MSSGRCLRALLAHPALDGLPGILEVPGLDGAGPDEANMELLRGLASKGR